MKTIIQEIRNSKLKDLSVLKQKWLGLNKNIDIKFLDVVWNLALLHSWNGACVLEQALWLEKYDLLIKALPNAVDHEPKEKVEIQKKELNIITWVDRINLRKFSESHGQLTLMKMKDAIDLKRKLPHLNINYFYRTSFSMEEGSNGVMLPVKYNEKCDSWYSDGGLVAKILPDTQVFVN